MRAFLSAVLLLLATASAESQSNLLVLMADDAGIDLVGAYGEHAGAPPTPHLDALAGNGVLFRNCWTTPSCSPSRAMVLTGQLPFRTGVGNAFSFEGVQQEISVDEVSLADVVAPTHHRWAVGKWHLATQTGSGAIHPLLMGFEHQVGPVANLPEEPNGYFNYIK